MNLAEATLAVWVMAILFTVFCPVDLQALKMMQLAQADEVALCIGQGVLDIDTRALAQGCIPVPATTDTVAGQSFASKVTLSTFEPGLCQVVVTVRYRVDGQSSSCTLFTLQETRIPVSAVRRKLVATG